MESVADRELDLALKALADPTRRLILQRLASGEARVTELAEPFPISLNSVSKHIRILERADLVRRRRRGREHVLSLNPERMDDIAAWVDQQRSFWAARLQAMDDLLQEEDIGDN
jgi:DNA-binding transcriptional ArsR family regulator